MSTIPALHLRLLLGLALVFLWQLHAAPLFDVDEGAFSQASREMLVSGDWGHTTLNGTDRFDKPILVYWFQAALMGVIGPYDWVARLPSALAVLAALAAVYAFCTHHFNVHIAARATFMLGTTLGLLSIGRAATADGLLNALIIATTLSLWTFVSTHNRNYLRWAYVWCALGLLTKGPIAVLVPGAALLLWSIVSDKGHSAWRAIFCPSGWVLLLLIAGPWYVYALDRHGMAFIEGFILQHNVERFTGTLEGHGGSFLYYLLFLPLLLLPWSTLAFRTLLKAPGLWSTPLYRFLMVWAGFVFIFFSISGTKLPHYMLYGLTPLVILIAAHSTDEPLGRTGATFVWLSLGAACVLSFLLPIIVAYAAPHIPDLWQQGLLKTAPAGLSLQIASVVCAGLWLGLWLSQHWALWTRLMACAWLVSMLWVSFSIPWLGQTLQSPHQATALWMQRNHPNQTLVQWRMHQPSIAFYFGQPTPQRPPTGHDWVVSRIDRVAELEHLYDIVYNNRGLVILRPHTPFHTQ